MPINREEEYTGVQYYTITTESKVPYQLTFDREPDFNRVVIHLFPVIDSEDDKCDHELKRGVCNSIIDYFLVNPDVTDVHFELELNHHRNNSRLYKFLKWSENHREKFNISAELIRIDGEEYVDVTISKT